MSRVDFSSAFYIKLGRGGEWEDDSISTGKLRFGWSQTLDDINAGRWALIEGQLRAAHEGKPKGEATRALNGLRMIAESGPEDVWITFHEAKLWWTRVSSDPVERDGVSMFRRTAQPWRDEAGNGRLLVINDLPGRLAQIQGYRWTVCRVGCPDLLRRTLSGTRSDLATAISSDRAALAQHLSEAIKELYWKDFETLVDLVFRDAGWIRVSVLGQHAKAYDLELREPITGDRYVVQVKSRAGLADLRATVANFSAKDFRRVYFVVHSPAKDLADATELTDLVEVLPPDRLARQAMDAGLPGWLEDKVS
jgi:GH24 family phage-related lysozyme (muramidase)